jgi:signal transduction histidine kinase
MMELHLCPRRAAPFAAQLTMVSETGRAGKVIGRRWLLCDITDRKRSEQVQRDLEAHAQQTHRIESLGTLAGGIAHDFNNLLTIILGNAELAARDFDPATPAATRIEAVRKAGRRAAELVAQMAACAGQGKARAEPQHLEHVVRDMAGLLKAAVPDKAILRPRPGRRDGHRRESQRRGQGLQRQGQGDDHRGAPACGRRSPVTAQQGGMVTLLRDHAPSNVARPVMGTWSRNSVTMPPGSLR